jgi:hypothetical protein
MFWIDISRTGIVALVMLSAQQSFVRDFSNGTVLRPPVQWRAQHHPKMKVNGTFLDLDNPPSHLTSPQLEVIG